MDAVISYEAIALCITNLPDEPGRWCQGQFGQHNKLQLLSFLGPMVVCVHL